MAAIVAVLVVMLAAVTLLPALLGFAGRNIDRLRLPGPDAAPHRRPAPRSRWSRFVQRRPWAARSPRSRSSLALAAPVLGLRFGFPDAGNEPQDTTTRQAYDLRSEGFGPGANGPLLRRRRRWRRTARRPTLRADRG